MSQSQHYSSGLRICGQGGESTNTEGDEKRANAYLQLARVVLVVCYLQGVISSCAILENRVHG